MANISVLIPAAGKAERFGGRQKKIFAKLDGRPLFIRTLELFVTRPDVCQTILAVGAEDAGEMKSRYAANLGFMGVTLVEGGPRRQDTVAAALRNVAEDAEFVAVHDAARPCVTSDQIDAVFAEAAKTGAAILAAPITATLKRVAESGVIEQTCPREALYEAQTPQVFKKELLMDAYQRIEGADQEITDDAQALELAGHPVAVVTGDASNVKITTKADLTLANAILKGRPAAPARRLGAFEEAQW